MPTNPGIAFQKAQDEFQKARTTEEKVVALKQMIATMPRHKSSERLQQELKTKLAKYKKLLEKEATKKKSGKQLSIKKEGAATVAIVGTVNSGKSTLLSKLTNAKPLIASYEFTTKKPEVGIMDYHGVKLQVIEIPAIVDDFLNTTKGPLFLSLVRNADLIILTFNNADEKDLLDKELADLNIPILIFNKLDNFEDKIWNKLCLIKVQTKTPGKKPDWPPVALEKGNNIEDLARVVHKDFIKKFNFARVWGKSVKHDGLRCGLNHLLEDNDIVEFHLK